MIRLSIAVALIAVAPLLAQNAPGPALHGIDVQVVDREGEPIQGLTRDQFEVSLNGQPLPLASATAITPGAPTTAAGSSASSLISAVEGRQFILAIDATSFTEEEAIGVGAAAQLFVDRVSENDRVGVFTFPSGPRIELTADRDAVRRALENVTAKPAAPGKGPLQRTLDGLRDALQSSEQVSGRKIVVLITVATKHPDEAAEPDVREGVSGFAQQAAAASASVYALVASHSYLDMTVPRKVPLGTVAPPRADDDAVLEGRLGALTGATGGAVIKATGSSPAPAVDRVLTETATYYLLAAEMRPADQQGVPLALSVRVKREGAIVRARAWHAPQTRLAARPASPAADVTVPAAPPRRRAPAPDSIAAAFERGEYASVRDRLRQTPERPRWIRAIRDAGPLWPDAPRRDAMFALEIAAEVLAAEDLASIPEAVALLAMQGAGATTAENSAFQCAWYWAGLMLFQSSGHAGAARPFIAQALARCPREPRVILADAVIADQATPVLGPSIRSAADAAAEAALHEAVIARYQVARTFPETAAEAQVREAWLQFRMKRFDVALSLTETLPPVVAPEQPAGFQADLNRQVQYIAHFVRGQVLREMREFDRAAEAFKDALTIWPQAQSASVSLMTLLATRGQRGEAERIAAAIETSSESTLDPWWWFWHGDRQLYGVLVGRLRELAR